LILGIAGKGKLPEFELCPFEEGEDEALDERAEADADGVG
jgi:hypothetical protein